MSRKTVATTLLASARESIPGCSVMKRRLVPSPAFVTNVGLDESARDDRRELNRAERDTSAAT
jgi:hypothetical protein